MIQLRVLLEKGLGSGIKYFPETIYICEKCNTIATFYSIPPKMCTKCKALLPDLRQIKNSIQIRKNYHLSCAQY